MTPRRYTGFIDTTPASGAGPGIGVTGNPSNGVDGHLDGLRRALEVLHHGGNDRELWHAYADLDPETTLNNASKVYGKRLEGQRQLF